MTRRTIQFLVAMSVVVMGASVRAEDTSSAPPPGPVVRIVNGRRVYELPTEILHGERQAPYLFTLAGRTGTDYRLEAPTRTDTSRVIDAVRRAPF